MSIKSTIILTLTVATLGASTSQSFAFDRFTIIKNHLGSRFNPAALNPQPLPPRWVLSRIRTGVNPAALNPQPLPPLELPRIR